MASWSCRFVRENCFTAAAGARPNITRIVIVLTDGLSYDTDVTAYEARKARAAGLHLFAVGIGNQVDVNELNDIASKPSDYYRFMVEGFAGLKKIKSLLALKTCSGKVYFEEQLGVHTLVIRPFLCLGVFLSWFFDLT